MTIGITTRQADKLKQSTLLEMAFWGGSNYLVQPQILYQLVRYFWNRSSPPLL